MAQRAVASKMLRSLHPGKRVHCTLQWTQLTRLHELHACCTQRLHMHAWCHHQQSACVPAAAVREEHRCTPAGDIGDAVDHPARCRVIGMSSGMYTFCGQAYGAGEQASCVQSTAATGDYSYVQYVHCWFAAAVLPCHRPLLHECIMRHAHLRPTDHH